nr:uncharacterized protein CTRU02_11823 [Colletotrichum truncatum]KAF6785523.1 hypothetical protein CTRU02_11823 [Colletotrichum truncatum]
MTLIITSLIAFTIFSAAAAAGDFQTQPPLGGIQPPVDGECAPGRFICGWGCIARHLRCCSRSDTDEYWSCSRDEACGGAPKYGCFLIDELAPSLPPLTFTSVPTSLSRPGGESFNPTFTLSIPAGSPKSTSGSVDRDDTSSPMALTSLTSMSGAVFMRETCFFDAAAAAVAAEEGGHDKWTPGDVCPPSLTSTIEVSGSDMVGRAESRIAAALVMLLVIVLVDGLL